MSPRAFLSLLVLTVVSALVAIVVVFTQPDFGTSNLAGGAPLLPELTGRVDDVRKVTIEYPGYRLQIERRDDAWVASDRGSYPVRAAFAADLVAALAAMMRVEPKTDNPEWFQYVRVGGEDAPLPARGVRVSVRTAADEVLADAVLGRTSAAIGYSQSGGMFIRQFGDNQTWLVEGRATVPATLQEWFGQLFTVPGTEVAQITLFEGETMMLDARKVAERSAEYETLSVNPGVGPEGTTVSSDALRNLTQIIVSVALDEVRARDSVTIPPDARTVRFLTWAGLQIEATLAPDGDQTWVLFNVSAQGADAVDRAAAIGERVNDWAFRLPDRRITLLATPLAKLVTPPSAPAEPLLPAAPVP